MVAQFAAELTKACSSPRLAKYRPQNGTDLDMLTNYFWNMDLAVALLPSLNAAEIALRNAIHSTLELQFNNPLWFYEPQFLEPSQLTTFAYAYRKIATLKTVTPGLLVAELSFGFWTTMLSRKYFRLWSSQSFAPYHTAFPYAKHIPFNEFRKRFDDIRGLRNRVAHHEPIVFRPNLVLEHHQILEAISWINPSFRDAVALNDPFPQASNAKLVVEQRLKTHLGIP